MGLPFPLGTVLARQYLTCVIDLLHPSVPLPVSSSGRQVSCGQQSELLVMNGLRVSVLTGASSTELNSVSMESDLPGLEG